MRIVQESITLEELKKIAQAKFGNLVKAVIDVERGVMAIDGELHADEEAFLIENGSKTENLWGINLYPEYEKEKLIEFDSLINLKPSQGNRSRSIDIPEVREKINC